VLQYRLASVLQAQGEFAEAQRFIDRAQSIREKLFAREHGDMEAIRTNPHARCTMLGRRMKTSYRSMR